LIPAFLFPKEPIKKGEHFMAKHKKTERSKELDRRRRRKEKREKLQRKEARALFQPTKRAKTAGH
jgi:hypothetical protein